MKKRGFSVLEIIFAIVILGVIASIAVTKLVSSKNEASLSSLKQDIRTITTSIQSYYIVNAKIDKISDSVTLNASNWKISDQKVEFFDNETLCVKIEILSNDDGNQLVQTINQNNNGTICSSLRDDGFGDETYRLD